MKIVILDENGKKTSRSIELDQSIFGIKPNEHVVYLTIKQYLANQRQGTHKSKERSEIIGSTKKLKKQKGSGSARYGDIKSPIFRGGGRIFGPKPRDYRFKLNKSVKLLGKKSVLSQQAIENNIKVLESIKISEPKTNLFLKLLQNLAIVNNKVLFILGELNKNIYLSSRNLKKIKVVIYSEVNTYDLINSNKIIFLENGLKKFQNMYKLNKN